MATEQWLGLPFYEILVPVLVWSTVLVHHVWIVRKHVFSHNFTANEAPSVYSFFTQIRTGWVKQNHLTGQAAANSTRDYLRVLIFYTGNSVLLAAITGGYCATSYDPDGTAADLLLTIKLGFITVTFFVIFFVMLYAVRYGTHFHMIMNVKEVNGFLLSNQFSIIEKVYHKSHFFYSTAVRMYFLLIPAFSWVISCWLMLGTCPLYLYLVTQYDDLSWLQKDIDLLFKVAEEEGALIKGEKDTSV